MGNSRAAQMHINLFLSGVGHHEASWRLPSARPAAPLELEHYRHAAAVAERGKMDSVFLADILSAGSDLRRNRATAMEPLSVLAALTGSTSRIGLIATVSTSYNEPFNLARRFATVDHLSGGRVGWNIVTSGSPDEAANFGLDELPAHADRYGRATEFLEVATKLWDGWEDGAFVGDKSSGLLAETDQIHAAVHEGDYFKVAGPLGLPRSPQGRPVLVQAGSSEEGKDFAAGCAEAVFTAQRSVAEGQAFYRDLKERTARAGRDPGQIVVLPGISPYIGSTVAEAELLEQELLELVQTDYALKRLSFWVGDEISEDQLDEKLPPMPTEAAVEGHKSRYSLIVDLAQGEDLTVRQLIGRLAGGRGHRTMVGTPEQVADDLELWFKAGAADGFNYMPPSIPDQLEIFVDGVLPILRKRGLFRTEYEGTTLRDHYGLIRPVSDYAAQAREPVVA
jgi:FMN-dependent oxidoreductase (nitrilotriacetate monooxygenase family)